MNDSDAPQPKIPNPLQWSRNMAEIAQLSEKLVREFLGKQQAGGLGMADPLNIGNAFLEMTQRMMRDPGRLVQAQLSLWQDYLRLWQSTTHRLLGGAPEPVAEPAPGDRRFKDAAWQESTLFDYIKQSYLLTARWLQSTVQQVDGLDEKTARKVDFYTRQFVDAIAPSNFVLTNPEVLRATIDSRGENLVNGLKHVLEDLDRGKGRLMIKMTDLDAFKVGVNIAVTKGKVVFQNALMQLIQYEPLTEKAQRRPLLIIPPWINKYYILDLRPDNSFIKWAVQQGHTVFVISWVNPDEKLAQKQFEDYMLEGPLAALDAIVTPPARKRPTSSAIAWAEPCLPQRSPIWRQRRTTASRARPTSSRWWISPRPASCRCSSTKSSSRRSRAACASTAISKAPTWRRPSTCSGPTI